MKVIVVFLTKWSKLETSLASSSCHNVASRQSGTKGTLTVACLMSTVYAENIVNDLLRLMFGYIVEKTKMR